MRVYQGFRDEARIRKTYAISAASRWDLKSKNVCTNIEKCKQQSTINDLVWYFICVSVHWISDRKSNSPVIV